ncbi:type 2 lanthipeptide synthetase LanM family protein [Kitasatospora sp. LaBMicrA B282]|uniref:type 2 lanthipeptide synthetase LanM family protein n=1 Tax=Kitasatospora sp. LaBMicrA B282 TaxID=3420949 RepID=UPI003D0BBA4F
MQQEQAGPAAPREDWFAEPTHALAAPLFADLESRVARCTELAPAERGLAAAALRADLSRFLQLRLNRVFLLELNAAARAGELTGSDPEQRWRSFVRRATEPDYLTGLPRRYPVLPDRIRVAGQQKIAAGLALLHRLGRDRDALGALLGRPPGPLRALGLGAGDQHRGGHAVARVDFEGGTVLYKPRSLRVDAALGGFLDRVLPAGLPAPIRVPPVLLRTDEHGAGYGWAAHVAHQHCRGTAELALFYRNLGHWLAVMRVLGGTDLHAENLLASGPVPVVVDAETMFTPDLPAAPSGVGEAVDLAARMVRATVLRTGILPLRLDGYVLAGVDLSAAGGLPGQQPRIPTPVIADGGRDTARLELGSTELPPARNHPSPDPALAEHRPQVLGGFQDLTRHLQALDGKGELRAALAEFADCEIRFVRRPTQSYVEVGWMLWHPASLHDAPAALARARDILTRNAQANPAAPGEPELIEQEIADLLRGDVPLFTARVGPATLDAALADWRTAEFELEGEVIRGALVGAYLNERAALDVRGPEHQPHPATAAHAGRLAERRRRLATAAVRRICAAAVHGADGTVTWISPALTELGWVIRPLPADLYSGQGGVALALAQYRQAVRAGLVEPVAELEPVLRGALRVLAGTEDLSPVRQLGGFTGLASQLWTWSALHELLGEDWLLARAQARAELLTAERIAADRDLDVLGGAAGTVVPLLALAAGTGRERHLATAAEAGRHLERTALLDERGARWSTPLFPAGIGGFAHGATGVGWALTRLALSPAGTPAERDRWRQLARHAFDFEHALYDPQARAWADLRPTSGIDFATAWCHGSTGIGLAAADLYRRTGDPTHLATARRAGPASLRAGYGWSHTLCHGDLGLCELLTAVRDCEPEQALSRGPAAARAARAEAELLSGIEEHGVIGGLAREAFTPGLLPGLSGVVHALLRMEPGLRLASPLLLGRAGE